MELLGGAEAYRHIDRQAHDVVVETVAVCRIDIGFVLCVLVIHGANGGGVVAKKRRGLSSEVATLLAQPGDPTLLAT